MTNFFTPHNETSGRQVLQHVVMSGPEGAEALYLRQLSSGISGNGFSTDTYINIFHKSRWEHLTGLSSFALEVSSQGAGRISLYGVDAGHQPILHFSQQLTNEDTKVYIPLDYAGSFFFFQWEADNGGLPPIAEYTAEVRASYQPIRVALSVTTFERNEDVTLLVETYNQACGDNPEIGQLSHMFVINNQIADAPKLAGLNGEGVTLVNNPKNTGGAGGFGLAARMAVEAGEFTHVLFMDDDIVIHPEAWFRTFNLLRNLKPGYVEQIIGGGMFQRENPIHCHTLLEAKNYQAKYKNLSGACDLVELDTITECLERQDVDWGVPEATVVPLNAHLRPYAAWWYCVIPLINFRQHGFPLPVFFKGDDIEFSLRIARKVLWLNGICVWHPRFESKQSPLRVYLGFRNHIICCMLHFRYGYFIIIKSFVRRMARALVANDYNRASISVLSMADYMKFDQYQWDGKETIARVKDCLGQHPNHLRSEAELGKSQQSPQLKKKRTSFLYLLLILLTLGGALLPNFMFKRKPFKGLLRDVEGKFPARYVSHPDVAPSILQFNRMEALKLSISGIKNLILFMILGTRIANRIRKLYLKA